MIKKPTDDEVYFSVVVLVLFGFLAWLSWASWYFGPALLGEILITGFLICVGLLSLALVSVSLYFVVMRLLFSWVDRISRDNKQ